MPNFLAELAARRRFGMKPGLDSIRALSSELGNPHQRLRAVHVAGTNGKGAVCAILDACLRAAGQRVGRYTSPHLVALNERFFIDGAPVDDAPLNAAAQRVATATRGLSQEITYFEALTAVAFLVFAERNLDWTILECGLGGRLDATNICNPSMSIITRIGLDHCQWLGNTVEAIASEKAGIVKPGVPVVLGANEPSVRAAVEERAAALESPFFYAPDVAAEPEIPHGFSLPGAFNRENAVTALAALKTLAKFRLLGQAEERQTLDGFSNVVWPGRFQRVGNFIIDGAHNPPAAEALHEALMFQLKNGERIDLIAGFCGDKDASHVLSTLSPFVSRAFAVHTGNPRSISADETASLMRESGIKAMACDSLDAAISATGHNLTLICGSLFLAGAALLKLGAYPWPCAHADPSEMLVAETKSALRG